MELYTEEHFNTVKARYLSSIIAKFENSSNQARDSAFAQKTFIEMNVFMLAFNTDDTTQMVVAFFSFWYRMGHKFDAIINSIESDLWRIRRQNEEKTGYWQSPTIEVKYYKILWLFNVKSLKKEFIEYDEDGQVNIHEKYTYDFSRKKLRKLRLAKTPLEKSSIFNNEIRETEKIVSPKINQGWIKYEDPTKRKLFKILVKYKAQEEFSEFIRKSGIFNTTEVDSFHIEETEPTIKKPLSPIKKNTRGRQVLSLYFILEELGLENHLINKSDIARLLHLLAAEDIPIDTEGIEKMDNSSIYNSIKKNFNRDFNKKFIGDLEFIKTKFEPLATDDAKGIKAIVNVIKKEIENLKK